MGCVVALEVAARAVQFGAMRVRGVGAISPMRMDVDSTAPQTVVQAGIELLLLQEVNERTRGQSATAIGERAGGVTPIFLPGENHGVQSAFSILDPWVQNLFQENRRSRRCSSPP